MKYLTFKIAFLSVIALTLFNGCKKDANINAPEVPITNKKLGKLVKVQTSSNGFYAFAITEYEGTSAVSVFHKDTLINSKPYTFQFTPHVGNTVHAEVVWRETNINPVPTIKFYYDGVENTGFKTTAFGINIPIDWNKYLNFIVP